MSTSNFSLASFAFAFACACACVCACACLLVSACGRTSPDPCAVREGLDCATLDGLRDDVVVAYAAATAEPDPDTAAQLTELEGKCSRAIVSEQLQRRCVVDRCSELCELHPCAVRAVDGVDDCVTRCHDEVAAAELDDNVLDQAITEAAEEPQFCTCGALCVDVPALCEQLWICDSASASAG